MNKGKCFACGEEIDHYDSRWYDNTGKIFCPNWGSGHEDCPIEVILCKETKKECLYWEGKLYYVHYWTDG